MNGRRRGARPGGLIAFLGPSLPAGEARSMSSAVLRPPAAQGDVFSALADRPRAIALIDGVFDSRPSVWHHELVAARACGVRVYGASSMGALRAAELPGTVTPVGVIARAYLDGTFIDDAHVALLHGPAEAGFRAFTVPHVTVWATARAAVRKGILPPRRAGELVRTSEATFFKERTWTTLLSALGWPGPLAAALRRFISTSVVDQKAIDARACLVQLERAPPAHRPSPARFSSLVRRSRLAEPGVPGDARALAERGLSTLLLAELGRIHGLAPSAPAVRAWAARLPRRGWADDERRHAAEALALEALVLARPGLLFPDAPSAPEGLRLERMRRSTVRP